MSPPVRQVRPRVRHAVGVFAEPAVNKACLVRLRDRAGFRGSRWTPLGPAAGYAAHPRWPIQVPMTCSTIFRQCIGVQGTALQVVRVILTLTQIIREPHHFLVRAVTPNMRQCAGARDASQLIKHLLIRVAPPSAESSLGPKSIDEIFRQSVPPALISRLRRVQYPKQLCAYVYRPVYFSLAFSAILGQGQLGAAEHCKVA